MRADDLRWEPPVKNLVLCTLCLLLAACSSTPDRMVLPRPEGQPPEAQPRRPVSESGARPAVDLDQLQAALGLARGAKDLGYVEKIFDGCRMGVKGEDGSCGSRYFAVVNFRLVCRDTEGTTEAIVTNVRPVITDSVRWKVAGLAGVTHTDDNGYGSVQLVGLKPARGQRLVLTVGRQFLGLEISQVSQIVVPVYWCTQLALWDFDIQGRDRRMSCQKSSAPEVNLSVQ